MMSPPWKSPKYGGQRVPRLANTWKCGDRGTLERTWVPLSSVSFILSFIINSTLTLVYYETTYLALGVFSSVSFIFYNKPVCLHKCFPEFYEPCEQMIEPKEEVVGTLIYRWLVRSTGDNLGLTSSVWSGSSFVRLSPEPVESDTNSR